MRRGRVRRVLCHLLLALGGGALLASPCHAQSTQLRLTSGTLLFPSPRLSNYTTIPAGATTPVTDSVSVGFTADRLTDAYWRHTTIKLRCVVVTGGKPCTDVQWRTQGSSTWRDITSIDTTVDSRWIITGFFNDPWSGTIWLRMKLSWTSDSPATYVATMAVTMDVTRP